MPDFFDERAFRKTSRRVNVTAPHAYNDAESKKVKKNLIALFRDDSKAHTIKYFTAVIGDKLVYLLPSDTSIQV